MRRLLDLAIAAAAASWLASAAHAADLPYRPYAPPYVVSEFTSGWYVRGDFGYRFYATPGGSLFATDFVSSSFRDVASIDAGIGYKARWFRADLTASWAWPSQFIGNTAVASPQITAKVAPITTLLNAYSDFGSWHGFTPYVGGGVGFSWIRPTQFTAVALPLGTNAGNPGHFDFAWDVTAGISFALSRNWLIDTSYRYLHIGSPATNLSGVGIVDYGSMDAQEVRAGLRFMID